MKQVTPMTRLKDTFKSLNVILKRNNMLNLTELNKTETKRDYYSDSGYKKGVDSDFLKIYNIDRDNSFAFAFNKISCELDEVFIIVTFKIKDYIINNKYNFQEFKTNLKSFISTLLVVEKISKGLSVSTIEESYKEVFKVGVNSWSPERMAEEEFDKIKDELNSKNKQIKKVKSSHKRYETKLEQITSQINKSVTEKSKELGIPELEELLNSKRKERDEFKRKISKELKLEDIQEKEKTKRYEINSLNRNKEIFINQKTNGLPVQVRNKIKEIVSKN